MIIILPVTRVFRGSFENIPDLSFTQPKFLMHISNWIFIDIVTYENSHQKLFYALQLECSEDNLKMFQRHDLVCASLHIYIKLYQALPELFHSFLKLPPTHPHPQRVEDLRFRLRFNYRLRLITVFDSGKMSEF